MIGITKQKGADVNLVVDTSAWSLVLRPRKVEEKHPLVSAFRRHIEANDGMFLIGNILQELLDGVRSSDDFKRLTRLLEPFPLLSLQRTTYVEAARLRQHCRSRGVQATPIDFLIAAACVEHQLPLLTADRDFFHIAKHSEPLLTD